MGIGLLCFFSALPNNPAAVATLRHWIVIRTLVKPLSLLLRPHIVSELIVVTLFTSCNMDSTTLIRCSLSLSDYRLRLKKKREDFQPVMKSVVACVGSQLAI